jgi:formylglycine-generating enzyme required for sulfatase activity
MRQRALLSLACGVGLLAGLLSGDGLRIATGAAPLPTSLPRIEPLRHKGYRQKIPGSKVHFDMVAIPGGVYRMGSPAREAGRSGDEGPRHPVVIRPFWMGETEVTWDEYNLYRKGGPSSERGNEELRARDADSITRPTPCYADEYRGFGNKGYPVVGISHHAAMEYCRWLSCQTGKAYRLPTEAEWEWACRAGTRTAWFFGRTPDRLGEYAWYEKNSDETTHPVGKKKPNPWGLYDIYGNAAEWCIDHYQKDYYANFPAEQLTIAPVKVPTADRYPHVVRGGSYDDPARQCLSAVRRGSDKSWNRIDPDKPQGIWWLWNTDFVGFRLVRAVEEQANLKGIKSKVTKKSR